MQSLSQTPQQSKRLARLLDAVTQRGHDRQAVERCLNDGVTFGQARPDARGNLHYNVTVFRSDLSRSCRIQLRTGPDGNSAGCSTCHSEQLNGRYQPHLVQDCPAVAAAQIEWILSQPEAAPVAQGQVTLLDLALAEFRQREQWNGEAVTVWQAGDKAAWLNRDKNGYITLTLFKDAKKLTRRRYSKPLPIGYWSPNDAMFVECHELREQYPRWSEQARREVA